MQRKIKTGERGSVDGNFLFPSLLWAVCMNLGSGPSVHLSLVQILVIILEGEEHSCKGTKTGGCIRLA